MLVSALCCIISVTKIITEQTFDYRIASLHALYYNKMNKCSHTKEN